MRRVRQIATREGFALQVRVLWIWVTVASVDKYESGRSGFTLTALLADLARRVER
jgi:hypothetical protein